MRRFKVKESMLFVNKNMNSNKNETGPKMKNPWITFWETNLVLQLMLKLRIKSKTAMSWSSRKKKHSIFCNIHFAQKEFFNICIFIQSIVVYWILNFTYQKTILHKLFCFVFKILESLQCILKCRKCIECPKCLKWPSTLSALSVSSAHVP